MALKKVESKVSLNIKVQGSVDARLKRARAEARKQGLKFNVSQEVENFLLKELKKVEKELGIEQDINEEKNQLDLLSNNEPKNKSKKVENSHPKRVAFFVPSELQRVVKKVESSAGVEQGMRSCATNAKPPFLLSRERSEPPKRSAGTAPQGTRS